MATHKFQDESPYVGVNDRVHHHTDYLYETFIDGFRPLTSRKPLPEGVDHVVGVALFGLGRAGTIHLNNLLRNSRVRLLYVVDPDEDRWRNVKDRRSLTAVTYLQPKDVTRVYEDPKVTACIVATPTSTHEEFVVGSLKAGKAVLSEKPLAESVENTKKVYDVATELNKPLLCAFNRRFDPSFGNVYQSVRNGALGHIQQIKLTSRDSPLPSVAYLKTSGGIFHDCAVHDIDMMTWVLGELPSEVFSTANAQIKQIKEMDDFDNVICIFKFPSGTLGVIDLCRFANYGYDQRLEVFGRKGMLKVDNDAPNRSVMFSDSGVSSAPLFWSFPSRHSKGYENEMNHFLDIIQGQDELSVTGKMTLAVSKIATACEESARSGKPIKLTWSDEEIPETYHKIDEE